MSLQSAINQTFQLAALASTQIGNISSMEVNKALTNKRLETEADVQKWKDVEQLANDYAKQEIIPKEKAEQLKKSLSMSEEDRAKYLKAEEEWLEKEQEKSSVMSPLQKHRLAKTIKERSPLSQKHEDPVSAFHKATDKEREAYFRKQQAQQSLEQEQNAQRNTKEVKGVKPDTGIIGTKYVDVKPRRRK